MDKQEYDKGYKEAIEAIKKALQGGSNQSNSSGSNNGLQQPPVNGDSQENSNKGNSEKGGNHGKVSAEDCIGPSELNNAPSQSGVYIDKNTGDKIAESEGYKKEGGSDSSIENDWKDAAIKAASQMKGDQYGNLKSKINSIYKTTTDWKKAFKNIIGRSISPEDKRQAYANKNVLISQDRISRTDKDKYDHLSYIMAWVDSSGSMSDDQLKLCLSEVYSMALKVKPMKIVVVQCDTKIQDIAEYKSVNELKNSIKHATVKGRGGTELKPCWDLLKSEKKYKSNPPELVMIFTDGYLNQYKRNALTMRNLCWVILDNPGFEVQYKDANTKCIHINVKDIK